MKRQKGKGENERQKDKEMQKRVRKRNVKANKYRDREGLTAEIWKEDKQMYIQTV